MRSTRCAKISSRREEFESLMAKGEASLVNIRQETISLSDAAEKKHGEFRDVQKSEMLRLRDETRLVLEMNVQNDVAPQYITATDEDRSRENADLALVEHSLKMLLSSTPIHSSLTSARRPCAWSYSPWGHFEDLDTVVAAIWTLSTTCRSCSHHVFMPPCVLTPISSL